MSRDPNPESETPSYRSRLNRRRSLFGDDDDDDFFASKPQKKFSLGSADPEPTRTSDFRSRVQKISDDFFKPTTSTSSFSSRSFESSKPKETTEIKFKHELGPRGQPIVRREETTYTSPGSGRGQYQTSTVTERSSTYESKPPMSMRTRRSSIGSGEEFTSRSSLRTRKYSEQSGSGLPPRPLRNSRDEEQNFVSAQKMRDARKAQESDELTENIQKMVNKMKDHYLDDATADIRSVSRTIRATSLDPYEDDGPRSRSKQRARLNKFTYGVGK